MQLGHTMGLWLLLTAVVAYPRRASDARIDCRVWVEQVPTLLQNISWSVYPVHHAQLAIPVSPCINYSIHQRHGSDVLFSMSASIVYPFIYPQYILCASHSFQSPCFWKAGPLSLQLTSGPFNSSNMICHYSFDILHKRSFHSVASSTLERGNTTEPKSPCASSGSLPVTLVVGVLVAAGLLLIVGVVFCYFDHKRRKRSLKGKKKATESSMETFQVNLSTPRTSLVHVAHVSQPAVEKESNLVSQAHLTQTPSPFSPSSSIHSPQQVKDMENTCKPPSMQPIHTRKSPKFGNRQVHTRSYSDTSFAHLHVMPPKPSTDTSPCHSQNKSKLMIVIRGPPERHTGGPSSWKPQGNPGDRYKNPSEPDEMAVERGECVIAVEFYEDGWIMAERESSILSNETEASVITTPTRDVSDGELGRKSLGKGVELKGAFMKRFQRSKSPPPSNNNTLVKNRKNKGVVPLNYLIKAPPKPNSANDTLHQGLVFGLSYMRMGAMK